MEFRRACGGCRVALDDTGAAYFCASECTFCAPCARRVRFVCPNCSGELVRRPRKGPPPGPRRALPPSDPRVRVRRAGREDLPALVPLFDAYREFYEQPPDLARSERFLADRLEHDESFVFVAEEAGRAVGFMQLYPTFSSVTLGRVYVLNDLFVAPQARGRGVASRLLETAREWSEREGAVYLELSTAVDNPAQRLYEAHGWVLDREFLHYELILPNGRDTRNGR
jgi:ribosomal protein S18 acetylase RimI-like enzyme